MSNAKLPVIIAGAGPVGMVAAADLVRQNIPVLVLEKNDALSSESRASTFHPPTLDMLDDLGFASTLIAQGLKAPTVQYSSSEDGVLGTFDFAAISDLVRIVAICDVFSALTERRAYRKPASPAEALAIMVDGIGHLDPDLLRVFAPVMLGGDALAA